MHKRLSSFVSYTLQGVRMFTPAAVASIFATIAAKNACEVTSKVPSALLTAMSIEAAAITTCSTIGAVGAIGESIKEFRQEKRAQGISSSLGCVGSIFASVGTLILNANLIFEAGIPMPIVSGCFLMVATSGMLKGIFLKKPEIIINSVLGAAGPASLLTNNKLVIIGGCSCAFAINSQIFSNNLASFFGKKIIPPIETKKTLLDGSQERERLLPINSV